MIIADINSLLYEHVQRILAIFTTILFGEIHSLYLQNKKKQQQKLSELRMYNQII